MHAQILISCFVFRRLDFEIFCLDFTGILVSFLVKILKVRQEFQGKFKF